MKWSGKVLEKQDETCVMKLQVVQYMMDTFLMKMLARVDQQYSAIETECAILRNLLKPWPKKKREQKQETGHQDGSETLKSNDVTMEGNELSSVEMIALDQMERLINKAQKTMKIKEKRVESNASSEPKFKDIHPTDIDVKENDVIVSQNREQIVCENLHSSSNSKDLSISDRNTSNVKQNHPPKSFSKQKSAAVKHPIVSASVKDVNKPHHSLPPRQSARSVTPRSSSASSLSRPSSSRSRFTPAHVNAPFKTDVNTRVPHKKLNHFHKNHLAKTAHHHKKEITRESTIQKQSSFSNGFKRLPMISSDVRLKKQQSQINSKLSSDRNTNEAETINSNDNSAEEEICTIGAITIQSTSPKESVDIDSLHDTEFNDGSSSNFEKIIDEHQIGHSVSENSGNLDLDLTGTQEGGSFSLKDKSSKIKVPSRLAKLALGNHSLFEKCATTQLVRKSPKVDAAVNFVKRLEESNAISPELYARAKALSCLQSHELMMQCLQSLELEKISEATPFETAFRGKKILEFILAKFAQSQNEIDYFTKVQFRSSIISKNSESVEGRSKDMPKSLFTKPDRGSIDQTRDVLDALGRSRLWTHLQFEKNVFLLRQHLMSLSEAEWWQVIADHPEDETVVQLVHSLLTSTAEFFTAVVKNPDT